jgi:hypothetical protein
MPLGEAWPDATSHSKNIRVAWRGSLSTWQHLKSRLHDASWLGRVKSRWWGRRRSCVIESSTAPTLKLVATSIIVFALNVCAHPQRLTRVSQLASRKRGVSYEKKEFVYIRRSMIYAHNCTQQHWYKHSLLAKGKSAGAWNCTFTFMKFRR